MSTPHIALRTSHHTGCPLTHNRTYPRLWDFKNSGDTVVIMTISVFYLMFTIDQVIFINIKNMSSHLSSSDAVSTVIPSLWPTWGPERSLSCIPRWACSLNSQTAFEILGGLFPGVVESRYCEHVPGDLLIAFVVSCDQVGGASLDDLMTLDRKALLQQDYAESSYRRQSSARKSDVVSHQQFWFWLFAKSWRCLPSVEKF